MNPSLLVGLAVAMAPGLLAQGVWRKQALAPDFFILGPEGSIAYDPVRERVVTVSQFSGFWEWDGGSWATRPNDGWDLARQHKLVWDPVRGQVISYGGSEATLAWDGNGWRLLSPAATPPGRISHGMTLDSARGRIVVFGGSVFGTLVNDTWDWNGQNWTERNPVNRPPARASPALAFDPVRQRTVLFGGVQFPSGSSGDPKYLSDTWEWDGVEWTERVTAVAPILAPPGPQPFAGPPDPLMVYDSLRQRILLALLNGDRLETWTWDGSRWELETRTERPNSVGGAMVYDEARQEIVLISWADAGTFVYTPPELLLRDPAPLEASGSFAGGPSVEEYGSATVGSGQFVPRIGAVGGAPSLGNQDFGIEVTRALGGTLCHFFGATEPANAVVNLMRVYVDAEASHFAFPTSGMAGTPGLGTATLPIPIPNDPALLGFETYWQAFIADPGSPLPIGFSATPALRITVIQ